MDDNDQANGTKQPNPATQLTNFWTELQNNATQMVGILTAIQGDQRVPAIATAFANKKHSLESSNSRARTENRELKAKIQARDETIKARDGTIKSLTGENKHLLDTYVELEKKHDALKTKYDGAVTHFETSLKLIEKANASALKQATEGFEQYRPSTTSVSDKRKRTDSIVSNSSDEDEEQPKTSKRFKETLHPNLTELPPYRTIGSRPFLINSTRFHNMIDADIPQFDFLTIGNRMREEINEKITKGYEVTTDSALDVMRFYWQTQFVVYVLMLLEKHEPHTYIRIEWLFNMFYLLIPNEYKLTSANVLYIRGAEADVKESREFRRKHKYNERAHKGFLDERWAEYIKYRAEYVKRFDDEYADAEKAPYKYDDEISWEATGELYRP